MLEDDILEASRQAHVLDFAQGYPDGLDTMVCSQGMQLSGGQWQRIALACVLANNPPIIILDKAISALNVKSEHLVQEALQALLKKIVAGPFFPLRINYQQFDMRHTLPSYEMGPLSRPEPLKGSKP